MIILGALLLWILYSALEGFREGFYWHYKALGDDDNTFEIHPYFAAQRGIVLIVIGLALLNCLVWWKILLFLVGLSLIFSFIHNGCYYTTRNCLNPKIYKDRWKDQSTTSTAKLTKLMNFRNRTIFFISGLVMMLFLI